MTDTEPTPEVTRALRLAHQRTEIARLQHEVEQLSKWKQEALPLLAGLQDLGAALGTPLGTLVTGPLALQHATMLKARAEAAETERDLVRRAALHPKIKAALHPKLRTPRADSPSDG